MLPRNYKWDYQYENNNEKIKNVKTSGNDIGLPDSQPAQVAYHHCTAVTVQFVSSS